MVTILRMCCFGDRHVGGRERHSAGEGEIDEVPIDGLRGPRKLQARAADVGLHVGQMRVVQRVDILLNSQASASVTMIRTFVNGCGLWPTASAAIAISSTAMMIPVSASRQQAVGVIFPRMLADDPRFARAEQRDARQQKHASPRRRSRHRADRPALRANAMQSGRSTMQRRRETRGSAAARSCCRWCAASP